MYHHVTMRVDLSRLGLALYLFGASVTKDFSDVEQAIKLMGV